MWIRILKNHVGPGRYFFVQGECRDVAADIIDQLPKDVYRQTTPLGIPAAKQQPTPQNKMLKGKYRKKN